MTTKSRTSARQATGSLRASAAQRSKQKTADLRVRILCHIDALEGAARDLAPSVAGLSCDVRGIDGLPPLPTGAPRTRESIDAWRAFAQHVEQLPRVKRLETRAVIAERVEGLVLSAADAARSLDRGDRILLDMLLITAMRVAWAAATNYQTEADEIAARRNHSPKPKESKQ